VLKLRAARPVLYRFPTRSCAGGTGRRVRRGVFNVGAGFSPT
jgi:hypothetical protein